MLCLPALPAFPFCPYHSAYACFDLLRRKSLSFAQLRSSVPVFLLRPCIAAGANVGLAIGVMYYTRGIHPTSGATTMAAVIGGPNIHALGYQYILTPIAIKNTTIFSWWNFYLMPCFIGGAIVHFCYQKQPKKTILIANAPGTC